MSSTRGRPASRAGGSGASSTRSAPPRSAAAARTRLLPGGRGGTSAASSGARNVTSCIVLISSGISGALRGATSTCSGRPVGGSAHTSTRPTVVSGSAGVSRSPAATRPATRRAGSGATGSSGARPQQAPAQLGRQQVGGPRQPQRGVPGQRRELVEPEVPDVLAAVEVVDVTLADGGQLVGPPAVGARDVAADAGDTGEERRRRLQRRQLRQRDPPGRLGEPDPRLRSAVEDPPSQVRRVVGLARRRAGRRARGGRRPPPRPRRRPAASACSAPAAQPARRPRHRHAAIATVWPALARESVPIGPRMSRIGSPAQRPRTSHSRPELRGSSAPDNSRVALWLVGHATARRRARTERRSFWHSPGPSAHLDWGQAMRGRCR